MGSTFRIVVDKRASRPTLSHPTTARSYIADPATVLDFAEHLRRTTKGVQSIEISEYTGSGRWSSSWDDRALDEAARIMRTRTGIVSLGVVAVTDTDPASHWTWGKP